MEKERAGKEEREQPPITVVNSANEKVLMKSSPLTLFYNQLLR